MTGDKIQCYVCGITFLETPGNYIVCSDACHKEFCEEQAELEDNPQPPEDK